MSTVPTTTPAAELSPEEVQKNAEVAFAINERIKTSIRAGREALWELAEALYEFDESSGWKALNYETRSEYLADPEVGLTLSTYKRLVRAWRVLHVQRQIEGPALGELDASKIEVVLASVETGSVTLEQALDDVKTLGWRDLREQYQRPQLGRPPKTAGETSETPPPPSEPPTGADASTPEPEPQEPVQEPEEVVDGEVVSEEEVRFSAARQAAEGAMAAWDNNHTERAGFAMYEALRLFMNVTESE